MDALSFCSLFKDFQHNTQHLSKPETFDLPTYKVSCRPLQEKGVQWLSMLHHYGFWRYLGRWYGVRGKPCKLLPTSAHLEEGQRVLVFVTLKPDFTIGRMSLKSLVRCSGFLWTQAKRDDIIAEDHQIIIEAMPPSRQGLMLTRLANMSYLILDEAQVMKNT